MVQLLAISTLALAATSSAFPLIFQSPSTSLAPLQERYDGHQVWRVNTAQLDESARYRLHQAVELLDLDVWRATAHSIDVRVPPHLRSIFRNYLPSHDTNVFVDNVQTLIDESTPLLRAAAVDDWDLSTVDTDFHDAYHHLDDIYAFGDALMQQFPNMLTTFELGKTAENRSIRGWKASLPRKETEEGELMETNKKHKGKGSHDHTLPEPEPSSGEPMEVIIQSGSHAREWVGPSTALYFLHSLLVEATNDDSGLIATLLRAITFTIVPVINPDGYVFSHDHSRMWRKNRQDVGSHLCSGIDLNSNWGYRWRPSRSTACSDSYPGAEPFEALETRAMAEYMNATQAFHRRKVRGFIDLHSYGQLFMYPFAHSCDEFPLDAEKLMEAGLGAVKAMRLAQGENFESGQACDLTLRAPGDSIDYAYGTADIIYSYSVELRDTGTYGFVLPPSEIRPAGEEITAGLRFLAHFIYDEAVGA